MNYWKYCMICMVVLMCAGGTASAQENVRRIGDVSWYTDSKAFKVGDVLTVMISESNTARKTASTSTSKSMSTNADGQATTGALGGLFPGMGGSMDVTNESDGEGSTTRSGSFSSMMTVRVEEVLSNGNLVVSGTKTLEINEDMEVVTLTGVVRPEDISEENSVYSYQIANAKLTYKGKGSVSQANRPGVLTRIINWIL